MLSEEHCWKILENYFKEHGFVTHQLESFNSFIEFSLIKLIEDTEITAESQERKVKITFSDVYIPKPTILEENRVLRNILPNECRQRDLTYDSPIYVTITETFQFEGKEPEINKHFRVVIGRIPIMLKSSKCYLHNMTPAEIISAKECDNDQGGYFIIKGKERVLVSQIRGAYNVVLVYKQKPTEKWSYIAEIRSMSESTGHSAVVQALISNDNRTLVFNIPYIKNPIPVGVIFKALGYESESDIKKLISSSSCDKLQKFYKLIARDSFFIKNRDDALKYLGNFAIHNIKDTEKYEYAKQVIDGELFPHLGILSTNKEKAYYLGYMINKLLLTFIGSRKDDDRDNYVNKRVEPAGVLCHDLFRQIFKKYTDAIFNQIEKKKQDPDILSIISRLNLITNGMKYSFGTGNWGVPNSYMKQGVSQVLSRLSYGATLSHMRRIAIQIGKESKNSKIRQINPSQIMFICPAECFDPNTKILLWNGKIKLARDIIVGDELIDDMGQKTIVKSTCAGYKNMYEIIQSEGDNYTVTDNHILTLQYDNGDIVDLTIKEYLELSDEIKNRLYGFNSSGVNWDYRNLSMDPYTLGTCLEDLTYDKSWFINDRNSRLKILAGVIDSSSPTVNYNEIRFTVKKSIIPDLLFIIKSLGFAGYIHDNNEISIIGSNIHEIPMIFDNILHTNLEQYVFLQKPIRVVKKDIGPFVGWQLSGSGRFLLADFTVVHNTPEGAPVGIVLNLALLTEISKKTSTVLMKEIVENLSNIIYVKDFENVKENSTKVFLNGLLSGFTYNPPELIKELQNIRKRKIIPRDVSISFDDVDNEIHIYSDDGRLIRPLFTVENNDVVITKDDGYNWSELVDKGLITYADNAEINNKVIAFYQTDLKKYKNDFCEISPAMMLGVMASIIPWPDHSQSPRNCYQCLDMNETVKMADNTYKKIKDIKIGDFVVTVNPITCEQTITKVINHYVEPTSKRIMTIITCTGRMITCTDDHLLLDKDGWVQAKDASFACIIGNLSEEYHRYCHFNKGANDISFEMWKSKIECRNGAMFIPIKYKEIVSNRLIADITTESENHSFIAGDSFCVHNSSMGKQAMSLYSSAHLSRVDTSTHVLSNPQKPLVFTKASTFMGFNEMPSGINAIVAILTYTGYNQEDSVIINHSAVERGLFWADTYKTYSEEEKRDGTYNFTKIQKPPVTERSKCLNYNFLDANGIVKKGSHVTIGDVIIGKITIHSDKNGAEKITDCSVSVKKGEEGYVDRIFTSITPNGYKLVKVVIRTLRIPELGDKFACYSDDTDVLTENGWKNISEIKTSDKVACLINKNTLEYHNPTNVQSYKYEGQMYNINTYNTNLCVTPEHRMFVGKNAREYNIIKAKDLYNTGEQKHKHNVEKWIQNTHHNVFVLPKYRDSPDINISLDIWCVIFGLWFSHGSKNIIVLTDISSQIKLKKCIEKLKLKWTLEIYETYTRFICLDKRFKNYMSKISKKTLPKWCFNINTYYSHLLLVNIISVFNSKIINGHYETFNKQIVNDLQQLSLHAGLVCTYRSDDKVYTKCGKNMTKWIINVNLLENDFVLTEKWTDYKGNVYCCTVPTTDGLIFVRRNGKSVWCGNSRSAQKSTCGMLYKQENMPFTMNGITPDLIIGPNCMPSRMTINQLMECITGKTGVLEGTFGDATPFTENSSTNIEIVCDKLIKFGFASDGKEKLINGMTGEVIEARVFIGPTYYQRLKHLVSDKIHCLTGDHEVLTINGWKSIETVTINDKVATLKDGKTLVYENPIDVMHYPDYEGEIYHVTNNLVDLVVTGNHRMWVSRNDSKYEFITANNLLGENVRYKNDADWDMSEYIFKLPSYIRFFNDKICTKIPEKIITNMNDFLLFLGIWYVKGSSFSNKTHGGTTINIMCETSNNILYKLYENLGYNYTVNNNKIIVHDYQLSKYLKQFNITKQFPDWVFKLSKNQTKTLLRGLFIGNGMNDTFCLKSIDQVQQLCLHAGWSSVIENDQITVSNDTFNNTVYDDYLVYTKCPVFCLQVPSEIFYVRRNGKAVWTGNSRAKGHVTTLYRQPLEGRSKQGGLRFGEMESDSIVSHGTSRFLKERLCDQSDPYKLAVCNNCGSMAHTDTDCKVCDTDNVSKVNIPYVTKLLICELQAMGISVNIKSKE